MTIIILALAFASFFLGGFAEYSIPEYYTSSDNDAINIGPLTTEFTPAPSCTSVRFRNDRGWLQYEAGCEGPGGNDKCCPSAWRESVYYSPGRCPSGYRAYSLMTTETRAETTNMCCPDGFDLRGRDYCRRSLNTRTTLSVVEPTTTITRVEYAVTATPIQIRFKATDSSVVPIPSHPIRIPSYYEVDPDKKKGGKSSSDDDDSDEMPTGVKVGIAFGVIGVTLMIIALSVCCCCRKKVTVDADPAAQQQEQQPLRVDSDPPPAYPGYTAAGGSNDPGHAHK